MTSVREIFKKFVVLIRQNKSRYDIMCELKISASDYSAYHSMYANEYGFKKVVNDIKPDSIKEAKSCSCLTCLYLLKFYEFIKTLNKEYDVECKARGNA